MDRDKLIETLKPLIGHWCRLVHPGPPVPFVQDFPVADVRPLSAEQMNDETQAAGCDVIIWTGQFVGGGEILSGLVVPSAKVAEAEWDGPSRLVLRKKRGRRLLVITILRELDSAEVEQSAIILGCA